jgi:hypothetical protein
MEAARVVSVTVTSKLRLEPLGVGLGLEPVPTLPHPEMRTAAVITRNAILISVT